MPFTDIAKVPGFEDFGFAFQEGASNVAFDDQHGIASFIYVEPMSHWLAMPRDVPRTYDGALSVLNKDLAGARGKEAAEMAAATLTSGIENAEGRLFLHLEKAPWCDGGVFTLNPDPDIRTTPEHPFNKAMVMRQAIAAAFKRNEPKKAPPVAQPSTLNPQPTPWPRPRRRVSGLPGNVIRRTELSAGPFPHCERPARLRPRRPALPTDDLQHLDLRARHRGPDARARASSCSRMRCFGSSPSLPRCSMCLALKSIGCSAANTRPTPTRS